MQEWQEQILEREGFNKQQQLKTTKKQPKMKKYTPIENAFYWIVTSVMVIVGMVALMTLFAFVEWIFA